MNFLFPGKLGSHTHVCLCVYVYTYVPYKILKQMTITFKIFNRDSICPSNTTSIEIICLIVLLLGYNYILLQSFMGSALCVHAHTCKCTHSSRKTVLCWEQLCCSQHAPSSFLASFDAHRPQVHRCQALNQVLGKQ